MCCNAGNGLWALGGSVFVAKPLLYHALLGDSALFSAVCKFIRFFLEGFCTKPRLAHGHLGNNSFVKAVVITEAMTAAMTDDPTDNRIVAILSLSDKTRLHHRSAR